MNLQTLKLPGIGALALLAAGRGGAAMSAGGNGYGGQQAAPAASAAGATLQVRSTGLGRVVADSQGRTLYLFEKDRGGRSSCYGACASIWPPLTTNAVPNATSDLTARIGTTKRTDGAVQVTYDGHPLYTYAGDSAAGQTNGEGLDQFGAGWDVLAANGAKIEGGGD
jgi:predicted lipoprotein with Yx(FWY)xxD motif